MYDNHHYQQRERFNARTVIVSGANFEDAGGWLRRFKKYAVYRGSDDADKLRLLALLLQDAASDWYDTLYDEIKADWTTLKQRFEGTEVLRWRRANELHQRVQGRSESVDDYVTAMRKLAKLLGINSDVERYAVQRGLRPEFLAHVIRVEAMTMNEILKAARLAERIDTITKMSTTPSGDAPLDKLINDFTNIRQITEENNQKIQKIIAQLTKREWRTVT